MKVLCNVVATAIIHREGRFLITQRAAGKTRFPNQWTVPGGNLEEKDFERPKDTGDYWYGILEALVRREVEEEVGLTGLINLRYVTSLMGVFKEGASLVVSLAAESPSGVVMLDPDESQDFAWVTLDEARNYNLIEGICEELTLAEKAIRSGVIIEWSHAR